jgi:hypothetical protein
VTVFAIVFATVFAVVRVVRPRDWGVTHLDYYSSGIAGT